MSNIVYYGEEKCSKSVCQNKAYFSYEKKLFCGVHSKKFTSKIKLPKRSRTEQIKLKQDELTRQKNEIEIFRLENLNLNKPGNVIGYKMRMMKSPPYVKGYLNVFPNFKHQFRTDGFGCSKLSPMSLGPVVLFDRQVALNLENFFQGSKCYDSEVDKNQNPSEKFFQNQEKFFKDSTPHRHKFDRKEKPKFFVWLDENGKIHRLNYIQSRQFYCNLYERLANKTEDFKKLKDLLASGTNLQICGYDGREVDVTQMEKEYLDKSKPFGHELCLIHMLTQSDSEKFVWKKFKTFNF